MHIKKNIRNIDKIAIFIVVLHTVLMSYLVYKELFPSNHGGERWSFFLPFLMDFPISDLFVTWSKSAGMYLSEAYESLSYNNARIYILSFLHIFIGALWWLSIYLLFKSIYMKLVEKSA